MRNSRRKNYLGLMVIIVLFGSVLAMQGCTNSQKSGTGSLDSSSPTPTPTSTPTGTPTATPTPAATPTATPTPAATGSYYMKVNASVDSTLIYAPFHKVNADPKDWSGDCQVDVTLANQSTPKDIQCYLEVGELDLWMTDFTINWSAPVANCPYFLENSYWFWQFQPGTGPATLEYNVNPSGVAYWGAFPPVAGAHLVGSGAACNYDYTAMKPTAGPNCCMGSYVATVHTYDATGAVTDTTVQGDWGGQWGNCAGGPATYDTKFYRTTDTNEPVPLITWAGGGLTGKTAVKSPGSRRNRMDMSVANYVKTPPIDATTYAVATGHSPNPYYEFMCLDGAYAVMGRIRLSVRKWDLMSELGKNGNGDPALTDPNINGFPAPYRVFNSWDELGNRYPGINL